MSKYADAGAITTKPYAAGGAYLNRMSDYCGGCRYDPRHRLGEDACPYTAGYWAFLDRNRERLAGNVRLAQPLRQLDRLADLPAVAEQERHRGSHAPDGFVPAFALLRSDLAATHTNVAAIVSQRSYANAAASSQDTLFAGLVKDAGNYVLAWYNHKLKHTGWDVRDGGTLTTQRVTQLDGRIDFPGPDARLACVLHRDQITAYAVGNSGGWRYLFTADVGRYVRLDDPDVRAQYRYGFGVRPDGGTITIERFAVRRR